MIMFIYLFMTKLHFFFFVTYKDLSALCDFVNNDHRTGEDVVVVLEHSVSRPKIYIQTQTQEVVHCRHRCHEKLLWECSNF